MDPRNGSVIVVGSNVIVRGDLDDIVGVGVGGDVVPVVPIGDVVAMFLG